MTRLCENCKKGIPLGADFIKVSAIGVKDFEKLFKTNELDFCKLTCLGEFWSNHTTFSVEKIEGNPVSYLLKRASSVGEGKSHE
jgi:hypothetical protein